MRVLLYTGKGGAGTTTVAATTAVRCAAMGSRTLLLGTGAAPSLAEVLDQELGPEPVALSGCLWARQLDAAHETRTKWGAIEGWLRELLAWGGIDPAVGADLAVLPGMDDLVALLAMLDHAESGRYDIVVVDGGPAAATTRLLALLDTALRWRRRTTAGGKPLARLARPWIARLHGAPAPSAETRESAGEVLDRLGRVQALLTDSRTSSVRVVAPLGRLAVSETRRLYTALSLYGCPVDLVVCNRVIPAQISDPYVTAWKAVQSESVRVIEEMFSPIPLRFMPLMEVEPVGIALLARMADALYGDHDPAMALHEGSAITVTAGPSGFTLAVPLALARKDEVTVSQSGDELEVRAGSIRRVIGMPSMLSGLSCRTAQFDGMVLRLGFPRDHDA